MEFQLYVFVSCFEAGPDKDEAAHHLILGNSLAETPFACLCVCVCVGAILPFWLKLLLGPHCKCYVHVADLSDGFAIAGCHTATSCCPAAGSQSTSRCLHYAYEEEEEEEEEEEVENKWERHS